MGSRRSRRRGKDSGNGSDRRAVSPTNPTTTSITTAPTPAGPASFTPGSANQATSQPRVAVPNLLRVLNSAGQPYLDPKTLIGIYSRVLSELGADPQNPTVDDLRSASEPLAEAITSAKSASEASDPAPDSATDAQPEEVTVNDVDTKPEPGMPDTPTLDQFLAEISTILRDQDGTKLNDFLIIEPPYSAIYDTLIEEIRQQYPKTNENVLDSKITLALPEARDGLDGASWNAFIKFLVCYLAFLRDVDLSNLLHTYNLLSELVSKCNSALSHASMGVLILPTLISYSRMLTRLALGLEKQPHLIAHVARTLTDESGARVTLPEKAANIMRQAFVTCLNDRTANASGAKEGKLQGKKTAIYTIANMCLKVFFDCKKTRNAEQIFANIYSQSPPLELYPSAERVTYLYYLGRYQFIVGQFYRAVLALEAAYSQCRQDFIKQRRQILIFLMTSNIILGRFPSKSLYDRPEAQGLAEKFQPICESIAKGDLATFKRLTDIKGPNAPWFYKYRVLLQLRNRCEVLLWRSLCRKVFLVSGDEGDTTSRKAATLNLNEVLAAFCYCERQAISPPQPQTATKGYVHPDFTGVVDPQQSKVLLPTMMQIESIMSSLVSQGLLGGFISHRQQKFAVQGAKRKGVLAAGFPNPWTVFKEKYDDEVPGWKVAGGGAILGGLSATESTATETGKMFL